MEATAAGEHTTLEFAAQPADALSLIVAEARGEVARYFADPPAGLCCGPLHHRRVLALLDSAIDGSASEPRRRLATREAKRWIGKICADLPEGEQGRRAMCLGWLHRLSSFPIPVY